MQTPRVSDILGIINKFAPADRAESWDNSGLQVGDPAAEVKRITVSLDPCREALEAAIASGSSLLVTHHPLIFTPLKRISLQDTVGSLLGHALRHDLAVISAHTNYDAADGGLNDLLAERLGLQETLPLRSRTERNLLKLVVFVPEGHENTVREAIFPHAVRIGNYDQCSFISAGTGTFRPLPGSAPFSGEVGMRHHGEEGRLEFLLREEGLKGALRALAKAHPYEEPAFDVYPLLNVGAPSGIGRVGRLKEPMTLERFAAQVKEALAAPGLRIVGEPGRHVAKVAVCGGSGAFLLSDARFKGADVLVTGDVKYHEAREAQAEGIALVDAGHFATEAPAIEGLREVIAAGLAQRGLTAEVLPFAQEREPFTFL